MKLLICMVLMTVLPAFTVPLKAQQPEFDLKVKNMRLSDTLNGKNNVLIFDIIMIHTNAFATGPFKYFAGQYFLEFNPEVSNGEELSYFRISSDLPPGLIQGPASVSGNQFEIIYRYSL